MNSEKYPVPVITRRKFIGRTIAAAIATSVLPGCRIVAGSGNNTIPEPPNFPQGILLYQEAYENWARETKIRSLWTCSPATPADVVRVANWAKENNYKVRPFGSGHGFAPTLLPRGENGENVVLVNTADYLNAISIDATAAIKCVTAQAGALLEDICRAAESYDLGLLHTTAPGSVTVAGGLAMNVHGAALPALGQSLEPGHSWGTLSNLVLALTAVVWDEALGEYVLKTFARDNPAIGPLLTCVARVFITQVVLQLGPNLKMRCISRTDLALADILAAPAIQTENSFAHLIDQYGAVDVLFFPFYAKKTAWVKTWTPAPIKPTSSREVFKPYNYRVPNLTPAISDFVTSTLRTLPTIVPGFNRTSAINVEAAFADTKPDTQTKDIWGSAYTTTFYVKPQTLRVTVAAWGVIVARENIQRAVSELYSYIMSLIETFQSAGAYPYTGPIELRAQGLDRAADVLVENAVEPTLSAARPHPDHPEKDVIIWFAINNNVDQPQAAQFNSLLEAWFLSNYQSYGIVRPEWTKGYAYTADGQYGGAWTNDTILTETFPATWRDGYLSNDNWDAAVAAFNSYDPHRVFTNSFLDKLFPAS